MSFFTKQPNTLSSLYLIAAFQGLFFALLLMARKRKTRADYLLASYFLSWAAIVANYYYLHEVLYEHFPHFLGFGKTLFFLPGPLLFLYTQATLRRTVSRIDVILHLGPFLVYNLLYLPFYMLPAAQKTGDPIGMLVNQPWFELLIGLGKISTFIGYNLVIIYRVNQHRKVAPDKWSFLEQRTLTWLLVVAAGGIMFTLLTAFAYRDIYQHGTNYSLTLEAPVFIAFSVYILMIGYYGYRQRPIGIEDWLPLEGLQAHEQTDPADNTHTGKYKRSALTPEKSDAIRLSIVTTVEQQKLFLEPDLTVHDLSQHTAIPVHHITEVLNQYMEQSFYDFINSYRVAEARRLLTDPTYKNYTLEGIGYQAGFKSRSSFYNHFKRLTGMTPAAYQREHAA